MRPCIGRQWRYSIRWMTWLKRWRRAWQATKCSGEAHAALEPEIPEYESYLVKRCLVIKGNVGNWSVLVPTGKEINWDAVIISERKQHKANWILSSNIKEMWCYKSYFWSLRIYLNSLGIEGYRGWQPRKVNSKGSCSFLSMAHWILG